MAILSMIIRAFRLRLTFFFFNLGVTVAPKHFRPLFRKYIDDLNNIPL